MAADNSWFSSPNNTQGVNKIGYPFNAPRRPSGERYPLSPLNKSLDINMLLTLRAKTGEGYRLSLPRKKMGNGLDYA